MEDRPIEAFRLGAGNPTGLILGTVHGDEPKSADLLRRLIRALDNGRPHRTPVLIVPVVNPDGYARRKRRNARGVDLNRNFPTRDWSPGSPRSRMYPGPSPLSEPESRLIHDLVRRLRPDWIITVHSIDRHRFCNNYDGPGESLARGFHDCNAYPVTDSIGYATPGSFGTWAGTEQGHAVLTLELPSHHSARRCWEDNRDAFLNLINT